VPIDLSAAPSGFQDAPRNVRALRSVPSRSPMKLPEGPTGFSKAAIERRIRARSVGRARDLGCAASKRGGESAFRGILEPEGSLEKGPGAGGARIGRRSRDPRRPGYERWCSTRYRMPRERRAGRIRLTSGTSTSRKTVGKTSKARLNL